MTAAYQLFDALPAHIEDALRASIERFGVLVPVVRDQHGNTIDGHHRARVADSLGVKYRLDVIQVADEDEAREIARTLNSDRRQLTEEQRRDVVRALAEETVKLRGEEVAKHTPRAIAGALGVSLKTVQDDLDELTTTSQLDRPQKSLGLDGKVRPTRRPTVVAAKNEREAERAQEALVKLGDDTPSVPVLDVKRAERMARDAEREDRQRDAAALDAVPPAIDAADITVNLGEWWQLGEHLLYCGDSTDPAFIERAEGAAFAFADPPYNAGKAEWDRGFAWRHDYLADVAEIAAVTPGISAIADFFAATSMPYRWSMSAWITNGMTRGALGFGNWIYVALFSSATSLHRNAQDHLRITVDASTTDETIHESRKPAGLLVELLHTFTTEGDTVVDPFLGSGTTLFAAERTGRRCVAAEINPMYCREIVARFGSEARLL